MFAPKSVNITFQSKANQQNSIQSSTKIKNMLQSTAVHTNFNALAETKLYKQYQSLIDKYRLTNSGDSFYKNNQLNSNASTFINGLNNFESNDKQNVSFPIVNLNQSKFKDLINQRSQVKDHQISCFLKKVMHQLNQCHHQLKNQKILYQKQMTDYQYQIHRQRKMNKQLKKSLAYSESEVIKLETEQLIANLKHQIQLTNLSYRQKIDQLNQEIIRKQQCIKKQDDKIKKLIQQITFIKKNNKNSESESRQIQGLKKLIEQYQSSLQQAIKKMKIIQKRCQNAQRNQNDAILKIKDINSQVLILESQIQRYETQLQNLRLNVQTKDKYISHLVKNSEDVQKEANRTTQLTDQKYKEVQLIVKENDFLKNQLNYNKGKLNQVLSLYNKTLQTLKTERKQRNQKIQKQNDINEDKWRKTIALEKEKCIEAINKAKSNFKTKERLLKKFFVRACNQMRQQLEKLKISNEKQLLVFVKLFSRDIKKLVQEGQFS